LHFFFLPTPPPPRPTLFPYTTLFRSTGVRHEPTLIRRRGPLRARVPGDRVDRPAVPEPVRPPPAVPGRSGGVLPQPPGDAVCLLDRKSTRLNSSHVSISYAVFCLKKK